MLSLPPIGIRTVDKDEIIRMAREAGIGCINGTLLVDIEQFSASELERFAALVAAHEREKLKNVAIFSKWYEELDKAVLAERVRMCKQFNIPMELANETATSNEAN